MNVKVKFIIFVFFLVTAGAVEIEAQSVYLSGYARNYTGLLLNESNDFSILQNTLDLRFEHSKDNVFFKANPYLYHYSDKELELGLRELYMDIYFSAMDIRIGKQQIIWGKADGVFITDIVSPKDLSEFLLRDFSEIRVGVTSVKLDYYIGNKTFELVWIPVFTSTQFPDKNSIWRSEPQFRLPYGFDYSKNEVPEKLKNGEIFAKFSMLSSAVDFEIMTGYAWDDDPTMHTKKLFDQSSMQPDSILVMPEHHRLSIFGGSFSTTVDPFVVRGEGAFYSGKYFVSENPLIPNGTAKKNYIHYLIGLDYTGSDIKLSAQFIQQAILNYDDPLVQDQFENTMTLLASMDFLRETLFVELFSYIGLNNGDALVRPKITYDLTDGFELLFGANLFFGEEGTFGQYDNNDMIYSKIKYSF
jgi:hypothetical protein